MTNKNPGDRALMMFGSFLLGMGSAHFLVVNQIVYVSAWCLFLGIFFVIWRFWFHILEWIMFGSPPVKGMTEEDVETMLTLCQSNKEIAQYINRGFGTTTPDEVSDE